MASLQFTQWIILKIRSLIAHGYVMLGNEMLQKFSPSNRKHALVAISLFMQTPARRVPMRFQSIFSLYRSNILQVMSSFFPINPRGRSIFMSASGWSTQHAMQTTRLRVRYILFCVQQPYLMSENNRQLSTVVSYNHELVLRVDGKGENLEADGWQPPKCVFVSHGLSIGQSSSTCRKLCNGTTLYA